MFQDHRIKAGLESVDHFFRPRTSSVVNVSGKGESHDTNASLRGQESAIFVCDDWNVTDLTSLSTGLRYSLMSTNGKWYNIPEPRLSLDYSPAADLHLKVAYARTSQYIHLLSSSDASIPSDIWVPVTQDIKPVISYQVSFNALYSGFKDWSLSVETYYKKTHNIIEYKDGMSPLFVDGQWESSVSMGEGLAYGVELCCDYSHDKLDLSLAYTLSRAWREFKDQSVNNGKKFPYKYDRPHNLMAAASYRLTKAINLNTSWTFISGGTITVDERPTFLISPKLCQEYPFINSRNNFRLPPSHCLSLTLSYKKSYNKGDGCWNFSFYNLYNAMNPNYVYFDGKISQESNGTFSYQRHFTIVTFLPVLPSVSYSYSF